jgi:hypothetical protein
MTTRIVKIAAVVVTAALGSVLIAANATHYTGVSEHAVVPPSIAKVESVSDTSPIFASEAGRSSYGLDPARTTDW